MSVCKLADRVRAAVRQEDDPRSAEGLLQLLALYEQTPDSERRDNLAWQLEALVVGILPEEVPYSHPLSYSRA